MYDLTGSLKSTAELNSGMTGSGVRISSSGTLNVLNGGSASMTTIDSQGIMYVSDGGKADGVTVYHYGKLYVSSGGTAMNVKENGGYVNVPDGATVTFLPNTFSGYSYRGSSYDNVTIHSGTTGTNLTAGS